MSASAILLKDKQVENAKVAQQEKILDVAGLLRPGQDLPNSEVVAMFEERLVPVLVDLKTGELVSETPDGSAPADYDMMKVAKDAGNLPVANEAKVRFQPTVGQLYYLLDEKQEVKKLIIPVHGYGLWG